MPKINLQPSSTQDLHSLLYDDMQSVNGIILQCLESSAPLIPQLAQHLINAGGKRIRPMLTLACSRLFEDAQEGALLLAAAVEFIHTATLLHDDVVDDSHLRRGRPSANDVWGNQSSVLVGDFLFARSFQLMVQVGRSDVLGVLSNAAARIAEGEVMQLISSYDLSLNQDEAFAVMSAKTAELFAASTKVGAMIAGQSYDVAQSFYEYGHNLGMLFQIVDDLLDYTADQAKLGKGIGDDFMEGKVTLPIILTYQRLEGDDKVFLEDVFSVEIRTEAHLRKVQDLIRQHEVAQQVMEIAYTYADAARENLKDAPPGPILVALEGLVEDCLLRSS